MITRDVLGSAGRLALASASVALVGVLLFLACNRDSTEAEIVGPVEPTTEEVGRGPLSPASLSLPYLGSANSPFAAFAVLQMGGGYAGSFANTSSSNTTAALRGSTSGSGPGVWGVNSGRGSGGWFMIEASSNPSAALNVTTMGSGPAVNALARGGGRAGIFRISTSNTSASALEATTKGQGPAVYGLTEGSGPAALFSIAPTSNTQPVIWGTTNGTGPGLRIDQQSRSGELALFRANGSNRIRFTHSGKGIFNGGTQTGGADVAEAFAVEGRTSAYEPGDVLVISTRSDRTVEKAGEPYSTRVVGVYATRPGVLLTERGVDESLEGLVPVGVIGVIPTKVSAENGPIRRGDILVTARRPGHAMRATPVVIQGVTLYPTGAILGRAMEEFGGPGVGVITVLVDVK
jgi:hypothetical protein